MSLPGKSVNSRHKIICTPRYPQCKQDWFVSCFLLLNISCVIVSIYVLILCNTRCICLHVIRCNQNHCAKIQLAINTNSFLFQCVYMHSMQLKLLCKWRRCLLLPKIQQIPVLHFRGVHLGEISAIKIIVQLKQSFRFAKIQLIIKINIFFHSPNSFT